MQEIFNEHPQNENYDYIDSRSEMLERMYQRRLKGYASLGYAVGVSDNPSRDLIYDAEGFRQPLTADLENAKRTVIISSPYANPRSIHFWAPLLSDATRRGVRVEIRTKDLSVYRKSAPAVEKALNGLMGIGLVRSSDVFIKYVIIDSRIVWYGSIDVLGTVPSDCSIMRLTSGSIATKLVNAAPVADLS